MPGAGRKRKLCGQMGLPLAAWAHTQEGARTAEKDAPRLVGQRMDHAELIINDRGTPHLAS